MPQGGVSPSDRPETVPDFSLTFIPVSRGGDNDPLSPMRETGRAVRLLWKEVRRIRR